MLKGLKYICFTATVFWSSVSLSSMPSDNNNFFSYHDGLLSIKVRNMQMMDVLSQISEKAGLKVYLFDPKIPEVITLDVRDEEPEVVLSKILKGCNYSVIFCASEGSRAPAGRYAAVRKGSVAIYLSSTAQNTGIEAHLNESAENNIASGQTNGNEGVVVAQSDPGESLSGKKEGDAQNVNEFEPSDMKTALQSTQESLDDEITFLENRINSGQTDEEADMWASIRGGFVNDSADDERLEQLKKDREVLNSLE